MALRKQKIPDAKGQDNRDDDVFYAKHKVSFDGKTGIAEERQLGKKNAKRLQNRQNGQNAEHGKLKIPGNQHYQQIQPQRGKGQKQVP